ncbi:imelysin family protein [Hahella ganghwensis]|uniref:imelysin family protein n=1 Tax=Hahella ganghwensis TaxID=286420 RepID=UPI00038085E1|nr:imelysin family protein [Hahella ganghwensis]
MPLRAFKSAVSLALPLTLFMTACTDSTPPDTPRVPSSSQLDAAIAYIPTKELTTEEQQVAGQVSEMAEQLHLQAAAHVETLGTSIKQLRQKPTWANLQEARQHWLEAHRSMQALWSLYVLDQPAALLERQPANSAFTYGSLIDQTPMLAGYLDTVGGYPASGLIHALDLPISQPLLEDKHLFADPMFLTFGMHPLEFILWSKQGLEKDLSSSAMLSAQAPDNNLALDTNNGALNTDTGLDEQVSDSLQSKSTLMIKPTLDRRLALADTIASALANHLNQLHSQWTHSNVVNAFLAFSSSPKMRDEQNPQLELVMRNIDRQILFALTPLEGEPGWHYQEHMAFSQETNHFWQGRMEGLKAGIVLWDNPEEAFDNLLEELSSCLTSLSATSTSQQEEVQVCESQALELREKLIVRFAELTP